MDLTKTFYDAIHHSLFFKFKTNNIIIDTVISTLLLGCLGYIMNKLNHSLHIFNVYSLLDTIKSLFHVKYVLAIDGKKTTSCSTFSNNMAISLVYSNRFKAIWDYLLTNIETNSSIREIKEVCNMITNTRPRVDESMQTTNELDLFVVSQKRPFLFDENLKIYAVVDFIHEQDSTDGKKSTIKTEQICITLYSYHSNLMKIKNLVNSITEDYLQEIENQRKSKKFIYRLSSAKYENCIQECWTESVFESNRTFDNMFFENKNEILEKIHFFLHNKEWYNEMGIPYTLGVGLSGPPGTGKSSFIKALANLTGRHIIIIKLQLIKTRKQLYDFWNEVQYNANNRKNGIPFSEKIIVIEDIDCAGDIILRRNFKSNTNTQQDVSLVTNNHEEKQQNIILVKPKEEDPICLDDILNMIDGVEETPGRILIISSNHYDKLDEALVRPGRIDLTIQMKNASRQIIQQMYQHFYHETIPQDMLIKVKQGVHSPAEVIQCYIENKHDPVSFLKHLRKSSGSSRKIAE